MTKLRTTNQLISNGEKTLINDSQEVNNTGESETGWTFYIIILVYRII